MCLANNERIPVEAIRSAERITIEINDGSIGFGRIDTPEKKRLRHDIAIAVQSYFNSQKK